MSTIKHLKIFILFRVIDGQIGRFRVESSVCNQLGGNLLSSTPMFLFDLCQDDIPPCQIVTSVFTDVIFIHHSQHDRNTCPMTPRCLFLN